MLNKMLKLRNKKGFTLMEMLIVVAIIAILIAIAIPTFNMSLNKSKIAADAANIRSAYAQMQTCKLLEQDPTGTAITDKSKAGTWYLQNNGSFGENAGYTCQAAGAEADCPVYNKAWAKGNNIKITYTPAVTGEKPADAAWDLVVGP